jgi:hypothetical protein
MTSPTRLRLATATTLCILGTVHARAAEPAPTANAKVPGDLWEVSSRMSMEGVEMAMPALTLKICAAKKWTAPPAPANEQQKCRNSDFKVEGPKATWKVTCENPAMTGDGEIVRDGASAYAGAIKFTSDEGNLTIKLNGRRVGDCDNPQN